MARENQGLQIFLISFIMLTIILGVTTFLFYKQAEEEGIAAAKAIRSVAPYAVGCIARLPRQIAKPIPCAR